MIKEEYKASVKEFLKSHPDPKIVTASTIYDGHVVCIKPIPTICGAELMCSPKTYSSLIDLVNSSEQSS